MNAPSPLKGIRQSFLSSFCIISHKRKAGALSRTPDLFFVPAIEMPAPLKSEPRRERFDDLKEAFALGALPEEERQEVEDYLMTHPELRAEVNGLKSVANLRWFVCGVVIRAVPHSVS
jgi:hypothetical protein